MPWNDERGGILNLESEDLGSVIALPLRCTTLDLSLDFNQIAFYQVKIIITSLKECFSDMMWVKVLGLIKKNV